MHMPQMTNIALATLAAICFCRTSYADLPAAEFNPGGTTFDLERISAARRQAEDVAGSDAHLVKVVLSPMGLLDGAYAIGSRQMHSMMFRWRANGRAEGLDMDKWLMRLELPPGISCPGASAAAKGSFKSEIRQNGSSVVTFRPRPELKPGPSYSVRQQIGVLVESSLLPWVNAGSGKFTVLYDGKEAAKPVSINFFSVAPVRADAVPSLYWNGMQDHVHNVMVDDAKVCSRYAGFVAGAGARAGMALDPVMRSVLKGNGGQTRIVGEDCIANGFMVGTLPPTMDKCPAEQRFLAFDPSCRESLAAIAVCPISIYREDSYFIEHVVPYLRRTLKGYTGYTTRWKPDEFLGKGCACRRCGQAFAEFLKKPEAEVMKDWPDCAKPGGRLSAEATRFRAREHGRLVRTISKWVQAFACGKGSDCFIPEIDWYELTDARPRNPLQGEVSPREYARELRWIGTWGPHALWDASKTYSYDKRLPLAHFVAARSVREHVDRVYGRGRPWLMSFPSGMHGDALVATPEWIGMAMDSYFFNRWQATWLRNFPSGCDARYWRAFAEATSRAGRYERYVQDGKRTDALVALVPVAEYAAPCRQVTAFLPSCTNVSPLQVASYDLNGGRVVAVFNFWEKGSAFFTMKAKGLKAGDYTVLADGRMLWTPGGGRLAWTADEFSDGIFLGVGAARTVAFEIRPAADGHEKRASSEMTTARARAAFERFRPALEKASAADHAQEHEKGCLIEDLPPET